LALASSLQPPYRQKLKLLPIITPR
jgi:hypothetical protein